MNWRNFIGDLIGVLSIFATLYIALLFAAVYQ